MGNATRPTKSNWTAQKYQQAVQALADERTAHRATKHDLAEAQDIIAVLTQENLELGKQLADHRDRFVKGGIVYTVNNGYVSHASHILPFSEYTFDQDVPNVLGWPSYRFAPCVKVEDRRFTIDETQYTKLKGMI